MWLVLVTAAVSAVATAAAVRLGWWAHEDDSVGMFPGLLLGGLAAYVGFRLWVPFAMSGADVGSIRQAKKALREAQRCGGRMAVLHARARLRLARWQRR